MTTPEIEATFTILATAGAETTATALTGIINHLAKDHTILARLTTEIRTTYSNEDQMTMESLAKLPYLNTVIEEGLRMSPPVLTGSPRIVPAGGETICGHWIPAGVGPPGMWLQRNILIDWLDHCCPLSLERLPLVGKLSSPRILRPRPLAPSRLVLAICG